MAGSINLESRNTSRVGLVGRDYRGLRLESLCEVDQQVRAGEPLLRDARRPDILITAPASGRIARIERGARRKLVSLEVEVDTAAPPMQVAAPTSQQAEALRAFLLQTGSWASLRKRPFGNIPDPAAQPKAVLVTAMDSEPLAPPAETIIDAFSEEFSAAVTLLSRISSAPLYLCHALGYQPPFDEASGARCKVFSGGHASGLPGRHIQALCPIGFDDAEVWHIGYQQAIALGHLVLHGRPWMQRVLSLGGDAALKPRCLLVPAGAAIGELLDGEVEGGPLQLLAGSAMFGARLPPQPGFLGNTQSQLTATRAGPDAGSAAAMSALIPGDWLESLAPPGIYPVPLMRALQLGDVERARELGALELVEEDLAPLSAACVSNSDYGRLLRQVLDQIEATL